MANQPRRRHPHSSDSPFSDEYLTALSRGFYIPPSADTRPKHRETCKPGDMFEETYPRYPFSTLVRMGLKLVEWIGRRRPAVDRPNRYDGYSRVLHR